MATIKGVTTGNKIAVCKVNATADSVSVQSRTGAKMTVAKDKLRFENVGLWRLLTRETVPNGPAVDVTLTFDQMKIIKTLATGDTVSKKQKDKADEAVDNTAKTVAKRTDGRVSGRHTGGNSREERQVTRAQAVVAECNQDMYALTYRIPTTLQQDCPNPSNLLWHFGFRIDWSGWILTHKGLHSDAIQALFRHWDQFPAVEYHVIRYHPDEVAKIRAIAKDKLVEEIRRAHTSLIERIGDAAERVEAAHKALDERKAKGEDVDGRNRERPQNLYDQTARDAIRTASESLSAAIDCARQFDETENVADLIAGLREAIRAQTRAFNLSAAPRGRQVIPQI